MSWINALTRLMQTDYRSALHGLTGAALTHVGNAVLVLPLPLECRIPGRLPSLARHFLGGRLALARRFRPVTVLLDPGRGLLARLDWPTLSLEALPRERGGPERLLTSAPVCPRPGPTVFFSLSFAALEAPDWLALARGTLANGALAMALPGTGALYALAARSRGDARRLPGLLGLLERLSGHGSPAPGLDPSEAGLVCVAPSRSGAEHSPTMRGAASPRGLVPHDAPAHLNAALAEMLADPDEPGDPAGEALRALVSRRREKSRVPWIFNEYLNVLEMAAGEPRPESLPPKLDISLSGICNIYCRFCTYDHHLAKPEFLDLESFKRLDILRHARCVGLSSGLGESSVNRHLPEIIRYIHEHHPHVAMNFFTNGVLLGRRSLLEALPGRVRWISVSLNAASRETWEVLCGQDHFSRVEKNLLALKEAKLRAGALHPLVYATVVLTKANVEEMPAMPRLCRKLGVDRLSFFPFSSFGYGGEDKFGPEMSYKHAQETFDRLWPDVLEEARRHEVSLEIPNPSAGGRASRFGLELRPLKDYARVETGEFAFWDFLRRLEGAGEGGRCPYLWRQGYVGTVNRTMGDVAASHFLYPCCGPLAGLNYGRGAPVDFKASRPFLDAWQGGLFATLRQAQDQAGVCRVCDLCRKADLRDPSVFKALDRSLREYSGSHGLECIERGELLARGAAGTGS